MARGFYYEANGFGYFLVPNFRRGSTGRIWVIGAEMYSRDKEYVGFWYRENMPQKLIHSLTVYVKEWETVLPTKRRRPHNR